MQYSFKSRSLFNNALLKVLLPQISIFPRYSESIQFYGPVRERELGNPLHGQETIIVIEDQDYLRNMTVNILRDSGYHILEAADMKNATETAASCQEVIQLMITDVILSDVDGKELYENPSAVDAGIRVLYMSGYPGNVTMHHGVLDTKVKFIQKLFTSVNCTKKNTGGT